MSEIRARPIWTEEELWREGYLDRGERLEAALMAPSPLEKMVIKPHRCMHVPPHVLEWLESFLSPPDDE